ncbi:MAG TPA: PDZ domain-containing protein [Thermoanaerobaculia bacterium]|nr:PDZ domain-containing protein [Thermoanaerobaculia bacterium]
MRKVHALFAAGLSLLLPALVSTAAAQQNPAPATGGTRLLRFPDIHGDKVAFVYAGDLWIASTSGGEARRLTSHPGEELFPKFSPDGKRIAFSGEYSGNRQVHVIGVDGGTPRQLTFRNDIGEIPPRGGYDNQVFDWTPDGKHVLFRGNRVPYSNRLGRPFLVPADGGMERALAVPETGAGALSPDGTKYVYTPMSRDFRTWKRHRGGRAPDVWVYDLRNDTSEQITTEPSMEMLPVWVGDTIYFVSDRDYTQNLFAYDTKTKAVRKVTNHKPWDVLWPSAGTGKVVYESGGWLWVYDPAAGQTRHVPVTITGDLPGTVPYFENVVENISGAEISPTGKRALLEARGDLFTVPATEGEILNLTATPGVREMDPTWSPDGRWIAYLSDRTGEYEVYVRPSDNSGPEKRVTTDGDIWRFAPVWSPDSKKLAFGDKKQRLRFVDVASGKVTDADKSGYNDITTYTWAPDSRWIAYTKIDESRLGSIWVYSLDQGKPYELSGRLTGEFEPVFDPQGRYLYFLSNRDFTLTLSGFEFAYVYTNPTRVYVAVLAKDGPALFLPGSDEEPMPADTPEGAAGGQGTPGRLEPAAKTAQKGAAPAPSTAEETEEAGSSGPQRVRIDVDGFEQRVRAIPGPAGAYRDLSANADGVFYITGAPGATQLKMYNLKDKRESVILDGVQNYRLSQDGKKILYQRGASNYGIVDARPGQRNTDGPLALDKLQVQVQPREEWRQLYVDAWRILRDWFYDPGMHGTDWAGLRDQYGELVPHMAIRSDLDFILGELGAELSAGHVYVESGDDPRRPERVENGLLGAEIEADPSGYFRVAKVFPGENWHETVRSPLTEPGVNVEAGSYILAVDGVSTKGVDNFYRLLQNKANRAVTLRVSSSPREEGARTVRVRPVTSEYNLRYLEWVQNNRKRVEEASGGRIGYIHLPDTATAGIRELYKYFYPQAHKEALIIDDRYNGGGFIPEGMVALLSRPVLNHWVRRGIAPDQQPAFAHSGPKVTLINGHAGSGGDAFPYYFRKLGLGPLIGTRTWGGLIGVSASPGLADGGSLTAPAFRFLTTEGEWDIENVGVSPDIEVIDRPEMMAKGLDPSLEKGIEVLLKELEANPPKKLTVPPAPEMPAPR